MPHLLSIISDQAVPNLHFIKQFQQPDSFFLFVTTQEMEEKNVTRNLMESLRLDPKKCRKVLIDASDASLIQLQLVKEKFSENEKYLINLTGGNKLMSQMVYQHFQKYDASMFYAPIGSSSYQQLLPEVKQIPKNPEIAISLFEYLESYGFAIESSLDYYEGVPKPEILMKKLLLEGHPSRVPVIARASKQEYKDPDKNYLMGTWFELHCYKVFKEAFGLDESQIACNVGIRRKDSTSPYEHDNEFDLMFIFQNDLYVMECKVYPAENLKTDKISGPMFKLASLTKNFGLKCKKYLAILGGITQDPQARTQLENLQVNLGIEKILEIEDFNTYSGRELMSNNINEKLDLLLTKFNQK
ncbi:Card1-like endonuclease domain-containing protein [Algoriphagus sp.]|uniref:Card1-like endonuclease domain-containing protein n=1 Tax=Algoriphagus sp. TaxID=1872435 RepID=UPI00391CFDAF